jgi:hypothetical protein
MAVTTEWKYGNTGLFNRTVGSTERIWLSASNSVRSNLEVDQWNPCTIVTNTDGTNVIAAANNNRYVSPTEISVNETATRLLNEVETSQSDVTFKITWTDSELDTILSNCKFYAFNGSNPIIPPPNLVITAFEHTGTSIRTNRVGGDLAGLAWTDTGGINGLANALSLANQPSARVHSFFIGFSCKVTAYGLQSGSKIRISFDVS